MTKLAQLQAGFQAYLLDDARNTKFKAIVDDKKVGATKRLKIYHDAYRLRIIDALANAYPMLKVYLGDALFESATRSYLTKIPSVHPNLRWYGAQMALHLQNTLPKYPIAAELAQFEWVLSLAFDAEDAPVLSLQDLAAIAPENWGTLGFKFHPAVQLLNQKYNTLQVWQALNLGETPPKAIQINQPCVVWRKELNSHYRLLEMAEYAAIQQIVAGASFGDLCEKLLENTSLENASEAEATMQAAQYLSGWLNDGLITAMID